MSPVQAAAAAMVAEAKACGLEPVSRNGLLKLFSNVLETAPNDELIDISGTGRTRPTPATLLVCIG